MTAGQRRRSGQKQVGRFALLIAGVGIAAFLAGARFATPPLRATHPLTGRIIPGIATDAAWMERTDRAREEAPDRALALIGVSPGMTVADVGAGTGYLTTRLAAMVGPTGKVYANEIQPEMLRRIEAAARERHLENVDVVQGTVDDARLPADSIDLALLVDVYHELRDPQAMLRSIGRCLRPDGRLALVEYRQEDPAIPIAAPHRMSVTGLRAEVEPEGFVVDRVIEELPRQHIVVFGKRPDEANRRRVH
jgi:predicted methyltransferase